MKDNAGWSQGDRHGKSRFAEVAKRLLNHQDCLNWNTSSLFSPIEAFSLDGLENMQSIRAPSPLMGEFSNINWRKSSSAPRLLD